MIPNTPPPPAAWRRKTKASACRVDGERVAAASRQPDAVSEPARDGVLARGAGEEEEPLYAEATEDEDAQLPLLPPLRQ